MEEMDSSVGMSTPRNSVMGFSMNFKWGESLDMRDLQLLT